MEAYVTVAAVAYAIGSINFAVVFSKKFAGFDVRERGSKNAGTTNVLRTVGLKVALLTLACDILRGISQQDIKRSSCSIMCNTCKKHMD